MLLGLVDLHMGLVGGWCGDSVECVAVKLVGLWLGEKLGCS